MSQRNDILYAMISGIVQHAAERNSVVTDIHSQDDEIDWRISDDKTKE